MERYPHILTLIYTESGEFQDGDYVAGEEIVVHIKGRAEKAGSGSLVTLTDGKQISYSWNFYTGRLSKKYPYNSMAVLKEKGCEIWKGAFKGQSVTQSGIVMWL